MRTAFAVLVPPVTVALLAAGVTYSSFSSTTVNGANVVTAAADFVPPTADPTVVAKEIGYLTGAVKPGGRYYVYATLSDTGNPASGVSGSTANVSSLTLAETAANLAAGSFSAGGVSYNRRSALLTASSSILGGSYSYAITSADAAGNTRTQSGLPVIVDATAPAAADVQTTNAPTKTVGRIEQGDTIVFTFSERIDPHSVLAGWTGSSTSVVVRVVAGGLLGLLSTDTVRIYNSSNSAQLPLGEVDLNRSDYVSSSMTFGDASAPSTMVQSGATITITLGRLVSGSPSTASGSGTMNWTPSTTPYDAAGNASLSLAKSETGSSDKDF